MPGWSSLARECHRKRLIRGNDKLVGGEQSNKNISIFFFLINNAALIFNFKYLMIRLEDLLKERKLLKV